MIQVHSELHMFSLYMNTVSILLPLLGLQVVGAYCRRYAVPGYTGYTSWQISLSWAHRRILQHMLQSWSTTFWATRALVSCRPFFFFWNRPALAFFIPKTEDVFFRNGWGDKLNFRWWQLKYLLFSPWKLGKMKPFWWAYFVRWVETTN